MRRLLIAGLIVIVVLALLAIAGWAIGGFYNGHSEVKSAGAETCGREQPAFSAQVHVSSDDAPTLVETPLLDSACNVVTFRAQATARPASRAEIEQVGGASDTAAVGGWNTCEWGWYGSAAGVDIDAFVVRNTFYIQPLSNITDWRSPPSMIHSLTNAGSFLLRDGTPNGFTAVSQQFSPGVVAQVWNHAEVTMVNPPAGPALRRIKESLSAFIDSPGSKPNHLCEGDWTITNEDIVQDVVAAAGGIADGFTGFLCGLLHLC